MSLEVAQIEADSAHTLRDVLCYFELPRVLILCVTVFLWRVSVILIP